MTIRALKEWLAHNLPEEISADLMKFRCDKDPKIEEFLRFKAIDFERRKISRTHIIFDDAGEILGYFSVALKSLLLHDGLSKTMRKKLNANGDHIAVYLIAQLGKNSSYAGAERLDGLQMLSFAADEIKLAQERVGSRCLFIELAPEPKLIALYEKFGFKLANDTEEDFGLIGMIMAI